MSDTSVGVGVMRKRNTSILGAVAAGVGLALAPAAPATASPVVVDTIPGFAQPLGVAISPDGSRGLVNNGNNGRVSIIDTQSNAVTGLPIQVGDGPQEVAFSSDGSRAYVTNFLGNSVSVLNMQTNTVVGPAIPVGTWPTGVAVSPDGTRVYVTNSASDTVSVIDTQSNTVTGSAITVGDQPYRVAVSPDGTRAYVTNFASDTVSVINTQSNTVTGSAITVGDSPFGVVVSPDSSRAYVTNSYGNSVSVIDTQADVVIGAPISTRSRPRGIALSPDGTRAYVATSAYVTVIDTQTGAVTGHDIAIGMNLYDVAVNPDGSRAYVSNETANTVSVIALQPSPPTGVTATSGRGQIGVTWTAPTFTGGERITTYVATSIPGGHTCTTAITSCIITDVPYGTPLTVTVRATNGIGTSSPSVASEPVTNGSQPAPPGEVAGVAGNGQVLVSWSSPVDDGGLPVLDYTATAAPGGATCTVSGTSCAVTGLSNGTPYRFTVTARNAMGSSAQSVPSEAVTPMAPIGPTPQPPGAVTGLKPKVHKGNLKVVWSATAGATSFRVRISKPGGKTFKPWSTTTKRIFKSKARQGATYRFQILAIGPGGRGPVTTVRFKAK